MKSRTAKDLMTAPVISVRDDVKLTEAIDVFLRWNISGAPVVNERGEVTGVISEHDIMNFALSGDAADTLVSEAMSKEVVSAAPETPVEDLISRFAGKIRRIPIMDGGKLVGIVGRRDILREMSRIYAAY